MGTEAGRTPRMNPGTPLDLALVEAVRVDEPALGARLQALSAPPPDRASRRERLLSALRCVDLTTLSPDDTPERVRELCRRARESRGGAAVCIFPRFAGIGLAELEDTGIRLALVAGGFPEVALPLARRLDEVRDAVAMGADEIDAVAVRKNIVASDWAALFDEVSALREACGPARLKTILGTGELGSPTIVARASLVAMAAGTDFIKTSTGKDAVNATLAAGLAMAGQIRGYAEATGHRMEIKPAGGIRTADDALGWVTLVREELGEDWVNPDLFRIGASALLGQLERELGTG